jgi:polyisoprenoid-binding protein YceI
MTNTLPMLAAVGLAALALAEAAVAQGSAGADPAAVRAGAYRVEPQHTRVLFSVSHMGFTTYYGDFSGVSGRLELNPAAPGASRVSISIPTASVSTTNAVLDGELKSADWLDAARDPAITFVSTHVEPTGANTAAITGDLTLHGITHPVTLAAKFNAAGINSLDDQYTVGFDATGHVSRGAYDVKPYPGIVGDRVDLTISAAFVKAD